MKFALPILALIAGLTVCESAQAIGRRNVVVQKQVVVQRVQRVRVQRVVVAQPVVAVQAFHAQPVVVQPFVSGYGVQQFNAGCGQSLQFNAGHSCQAFFAH